MPLHLPLQALILAAAGAWLDLDWRVAARSTQDLFVVADEREVRILGDGGMLRLRGSRLDSACREDREQHLDDPGLIVTDFVPMSSCPGTPALWRRSGPGWKRLRTLETNDLLSASWTRKRTLLALVPWGEGPPWGYDLAVAGGGPAPRPERAGSFLRGDDTVPCRTRLQDPLRMWTFPRGEVHVLGGGECPEPISPNLVHERWAPGSATSRIERVPLAELQAAAAGGPDNLWLAGPVDYGGASRLAHFDGRGWSLVLPPVGGTIVSLAWERAHDLEAEGLWIRTDSVLARWSWPRQTGGGDLDSFALPESCSTPGAFAVRDGHPWISCGTTVRTTDTTLTEVVWPYVAGNECGRRWIGSPAPGTGCSSIRQTGFELPPPPRPTRTQPPTILQGIDSPAR